MTATVTPVNIKIKRYQPPGFKQNTTSGLLKLKALSVQCADDSWDNFYVAKMFNWLNLPTERVITTTNAKVFRLTLSIANTLLNWVCSEAVQTTCSVPGAWQLIITALLVDFIASERGLFSIKYKCENEF